MNKVLQIKDTNVPEENSASKQHRSSKTESKYPEIGKIQFDNLKVPEKAEKRDRRTEDRRK